MVRVIHDLPLHKFWDLVPLRYIERNGGYLVFAIFANELVEFVLSTTHDYDSRTELDESFSNTSPDARAGSDHKNMTVGERHGCYIKDNSITIYQLSMTSERLSSILDCKSQT